MSIVCDDRKDLTPARPIMRVKTEVTDPKTEEVVCVEMTWYVKGKHFCDEHLKARAMDFDFASVIKDAPLG